MMARVRSHESGGGQVRGTGDDQGTVPGQGFRHLRGHRIDLGVDRGRLLCGPLDGPNNRSGGDSRRNRRGATSGQRIGVSGTVGSLPVIAGRRERGEPNRSAAPPRPPTAPPPALHCRLTPPTSYGLDLALHHPLHGRRSRSGGDSRGTDDEARSVNGIGVVPELVSSLPVIAGRRLTETGAKRAEPFSGATTPAGVLHHRLRIAGRLRRASHGLDGPSTARCTAGTGAGPRGASACDTDDEAGGTTVSCRWASGRRSSPASRASLNASAHRAGQPGPRVSTERLAEPCPISGASPPTRSSPVFSATPVASTGPERRPPADRALHWPAGHPRKPDGDCRRIGAGPGRHCQSIGAGRRGLGRSAIGLGPDRPPPAAPAGPGADHGRSIGAVR